jgi:hypothetical protein
MQTQNMRRLITWMMIIFLAGAANADWSPEQQELISLSDEWIVAEVAQDEGALERILDERFLVTYASSGKTVDRSTFIAGIMKSKLEPFQVINEIVNIHGDTALVISTTNDHTIKFTWIAVRKGGRWKVISETFSKMAETP